MSVPMRPIPPPQSQGARELRLQGSMQAASSAAGSALLTHLSPTCSPFAALPPAAPSSVCSSSDLSFALLVAASGGGSSLDTLVLSHAN